MTRYNYKIKSDSTFRRKLFQKENEIEILNCNDQNKSDGIPALTDKINELVLEIERLKNN